MEKLMVSAPSMAAGALPHVVRKMRDADVRARRHALEVMRKLLQVAPGEVTEALPHVVSALQDEDVGVRCHAL